MDLFDPLVLVGASIVASAIAAGAWLLHGRVSGHRLAAREECHRSELAQRDAQIDAIRGALGARKGDLRDAHAEIERLRANLEAVQRTLQQQGTSVSRLNRELDGSARDFDVQATTIGSLEKLLRKREATIRELSNEILGRVRKIESLERALSNTPVIVSRPRQVG